MCVISHNIELARLDCDIPESPDRAVAQVYLPPLLHVGQEFDLRIYFHVTSCDALRACTFREGIIRSA
jgi:hypothetical protein